MLPVTNPELPANENATPLVAGNEYKNNLAKTVSLLNQQPSGSFTPDLSALDAIIKSIEVK